MFVSKTSAVILCAVAASLFLVGETQAQSARKAGSSSRGNYSKGNTSGSSSKTAAKKMTVRGNLNVSISQTTLLQVFDGNGDNVVSKTEASKIMMLLDGLDTNKDGRISAKEMSMESIYAVAPDFEADQKRAMTQKEMEMKEMEGKASEVSANTLGK